jgi:hypothetical protein
MTTHHSSNKPEGRIFSVLDKYVGRHVRRHNRLLVFVTSFILALTFVVRQAIGEQLKDLVNSIDSAEVLYTIQEGNRDTQDRLWSIGKDVADIKQPGVPRTPERQRRAENRGKWSELDWTMQSYENGLEYIARLANKLPDPNQFKNRLEVGRNEEKRIAKVVASQHDTFVPITVDVMTFDIYMGDLNRDILRAANGVRETREKWFKTFTWTSYVLYGAGSIVGLLLALFSKGETAGIAE